MATLSDIEKYKMSSGRYDIEAIYRDLEPAHDMLDNVFAAFFGDSDDDGSPVEENELVTLARAENERLAAEAQDAAEAEGRELIAGLEQATTGAERNRIWHRLVELRFARFTGDSEGLSCELTEAGMALCDYEPVPDPYADQVGVEEEPGRPGSSTRWGGYRPGAGRPKAEQRQQGVRLWVPFRDEDEAARLRAVPPETRRERLLRDSD
jgi:hypothetical protein